MVQGYCNKIVEEAKNHYYIICGGIISKWRKPLFHITAACLQGAKGI
jgi:hypothetical protein